MFRFWIVCLALLGLLYWRLSVVQKNTVQVCLPVQEIISCYAGTWGLFSNKPDKCLVRINDKKVVLDRYRIRGGTYCYYTKRKKE